MTQTPFESAGRAFARSLRDHWKLFLVEGIVLVLLGCAAVVLGTLNVVGGFVVTDRMLEMFKDRKK